MKEKLFRSNHLLSNTVKACLFTFFTLIFSVILSAQTIEEIKKLQTQEIQLKNCIQMFGQEKFIIKNERDFQTAIRNDASRNYCLANLEKIDFDKNSLLGININSGYCRKPAGLEHEVIKDENNNKYIFKIRFIDPQGSVCRALSSYDLWIIVPKIPDDFNVEFEITPKSTDLN